MRHELSTTDESVDAKNVSGDSAEIVSGCGDEYEYE